MTADLFEKVSDRVSVYEVSPRDGLQNERKVVAVADKIRLIEALVASGLKRIEATSFVSAKWVPQLADAAEVCAALPNASGVTFSALVPNAKGLEGALAAKLPEIAVFVSATESHNRANVNKSVQTTLKVFEEIIPPARSRGLSVRAYVSTVWGCPYEGDVPIESSVRIAKRLVELGCYQISLGDTIGVGTPKKTRDIVAAMLSEFEADQIALHMHDTRGTALANVLVGLQFGIRCFDAAVGGVGGCPYAPGASGNLATEDLVYMLEGLGIETGVDLGKLIAAGHVASTILSRPLAGKVHLAGPFRRRSM